MTRYVVTIPYAYKPIFEKSINTMQLPVENIYAVDNTEINDGVAGSWNLGIDEVIEQKLDWLIVMSAAVTFGDLGGTDMIEQLEKYPDADVIHFAEKHVPEQDFIRGNSLGYHEGNLQWHLTAINKRVIERVGYFDSNFYPCYFEDIDYDLRIRKAFENPKWLILPIDAYRGELQHAVKYGRIDSPSEPLIAYFATKWGVHPSAIRLLGSYDTPFNEQHSVKFFPPNQGWSGRD